MRLKFLFFVVMAVGLLTQNADAQSRGRAPQADAQGGTQHPHPSKVYGYITLFDGQQQNQFDQWHMTRNLEIGGHQQEYSFLPVVPSARIVFRAVNGRGSHVLPLDETTLQHPFSDFCEAVGSGPKAFKYEVFFILDARAVTPQSRRDSPERINSSANPRDLHPLYGRIDPNRRAPVLSVTYSPDQWIFDRIEVDSVQIPTLFHNDGQPLSGIDPMSYIPVPLRPIQLPVSEF